MAWWRQARFGMFIHWGLYAIPAGKWNDKTGHGEWIHDTARIPVETYEKFQPQWRPRYLVTPGRASLPRVIMDLTSLIAGSARRIVMR